MSILDLVGRGGSSPYKSIWKCIVEKFFFVFKSSHLIGTGFTAVEPNCQKQPIQMCHNATFKKLLSSPWHLKCLSLSTLTATIYCSTKMHEREIHVKIQEIIKNNCNFFCTLSQEPVDGFSKTFFLWLHLAKRDWFHLLWAFKLVQVVRQMSSKGKIPFFVDRETFRPFQGRLGSKFGLDHYDWLTSRSP